MYTDLIGKKVLITTEEGAKYIITQHQAKVSRGIKSVEYKNID